MSFREECADMATFLGLRYFIFMLEPKAIGILGLFYNSILKEENPNI